MTQSAKIATPVQPVLFPYHFDKPTALEFVEMNQSSNAGLLCVGAVDRCYGITERFAAALHDQRCQGKIEHTTLEVIRQRAYGLHGGYADANDAARLNADPTLRVLLDQPLDEKTVLATQATLSRFENSITASALLRAGLVLTDSVIQAQRPKHKHCRRITIDLDPTHDPTHGQQAFTFFNTYYDCWCYLPLIATITFHDRHDHEEPERYLVVALLRRGNAHATLGADFVIRHLVERLRAAFPKAALRLRADGSFGVQEILELAERLKLEYILNVPRNSVLDRIAEPFLAQARALAKIEGETARVYGETRYAAGTWIDKDKQPQLRRVIVRAEVTYSPNEPQKVPKDNPRFVVTNLRYAPQPVYEKHYCPRGDFENRLKELKDGLFLDRTSCTDFLANQFRVLLSALAFVLFQILRDQCAGTVAARWQVQTFRDRLFKTAALALESCRRFVFRLARSGPDAELLSLIGRRLAKLKLA